MSPTPRWISRAARPLLLALLAVSASCADLFGVDHPDLTLSAYLAPPATGPFEIVAQVGGTQTTLTVDAAQRARDRTLYGVRFGAVPVSVALLSAAGNTLATVQFTHQLDRDAVHWVRATVGALRPDGFCMGELVFAPVVGSSTDTLFVNYGGLPKNVLC